MPDIRYVCFSDLHLGAANSVLTHLDGDDQALPGDGSYVAGDDPAPLLQAVLEGVRQLIDRSGSDAPTLVLHGDLFELALTTTERAAETFGQLVIQAWGDPARPLFDYEVLFIPGNHDHHLWEMTREHQYERSMTGSGTEIAPMRHVTVIDPGQIPATEREPFVGVLARHTLNRIGVAAQPSFRVLYPNLGLLDETADRAVVITHGHYLEPMYRAMTFLHNVVMPDRPERLNSAQLEADNWAWIDFFWSTVGRSGEGDGDAIPVLYEMLQSEDAINGIVDRVLDDLLPRDRSWRRGLQRWGLRQAGRQVSQAVVARERHHGSVLSPEATVGLTRYLEGPVLHQLRNEIGPVGQVPRRVDLVFGHTHKPFSARRRPAGIAGPVVAHNTGGWVVDAVDPEPMKGAAIALISSDLEVVNLRIYRQEHDPTRYQVAVVEISDPPDEPTPLRDWLHSVVDPLQEPWAGIARQAERAVEKRQDQLDRRIQMGTVKMRTEAPVGPRGW